MWGYYGSKCKIIQKYPKPKFNKIIEPFAGTAQYALKYWENDIILTDKYKIIINIWKWLQKCSRKDIIGIRILKYGESTDDFEWDCLEQKHLMGYIIGAGSARPRKKVSKWRTGLNSNRQSNKLKQIADNLYKIKHWKIIEACYKGIKNQKATWFIDPPYIEGGEQYTYGSEQIDYEKLAKWCRSRFGQTIVCESMGATWLPFKFLLKTRGLNKYIEVIWVNKK